MAIVVPNFTIADNENDTGVTVEVSGSSAGTTNTFKVKTVENHFDNTGSFVDEGSVFEDGFIAAGVAKAFFRGKIESTDGFDTVETGEQFFAATDLREIEGDAFLTTVIKAAKGHLLNVGSFPGDLDSSRIYDFAIQNPAIGQHTEMPCILITYGTSVEIGGTNLRDDVEIPILFTVLNRKAPTARPEDVNTELKWVDLIKRNFRGVSTLIGAKEVYSVTVETLDIWDERLPEYEMFAAGHLIKFKARLTRG